MTDKINIPMVPIKKARIRHFFFMRNAKNKAAFKKLKECPCGTEGSCDACVGPCEYLWSRWQKLCHPLHWLLGRIA